MQYFVTRKLVIPDHKLSDSDKNLLFLIGPEEEKFVGLVLTSAKMQKNGVPVAV